MVRVHESVTAVDAGSEVRGIADSVADALASITDRKRWGVRRNGDRGPIEFPLRLAIGRRDEFTCQRCHVYTGTTFQLDHIIPWSAGGSDEATNLRVLCPPCNQERSNYDDSAQLKQPVTWWCVDCWTKPPRIPRPRMSSNHDLNVDRFVQDGLLVAYCAYCRHLSRTDMTLHPTTNPLKTTKEN